MIEKDTAWRGLYLPLVILAGLVLIWASEGLIFQNNGDFRRASEFMLADVTRGTHVSAEFRSGDFGSPAEFSVAGYLFFLFGWVQRFFGTHYYLAVSAIAGKVVLVASLALLAHLAAGRQRPAARALLFLALALGAFAAHNIGMMKSFYYEYAVFLALPWLLAGFLAPEKMGRVAGLGLGSLIVGLAKVQYFYVPLLTLACLLLVRRRGDPWPSWGVVGALLVSQALCVLTLRANPNQQVHNYHSMYFGSYLVMSQEQLRSLGLSEKELKCVGVDAWGNFASGPGALDVRPGMPSCILDRERHLRDVLQPYRQDPLVAWRLLAFAMPAHFTVAYFHVYPGFRFLQVLDGPAPVGQGALLRLSEWRERYLTPLAAIPMVLALLLCGIGMRERERRFSPMFLFIALFVPSQIVVCLLGDGVRDLSRHLWAAQLAIDLMVPLLFWRLWERYAPRPNAKRAQVSTGDFPATIARQDLH